MTQISATNTIKEYLDRTDWRVKANANQNYSLGGMILNSAGKIIANYWLSEIYTPEIEHAHRNADIHIHDLDIFGGYCAGWSLRQLLEEGFNGVDSRIESLPPRHMSSAVGQITNFLGTLQNEWAGAQAFSSFDTLMAPFIRKDNMTYEDVYQNIQELIYNLNVPSRWGSQAPFTNLTFDLNPPEDMRNNKPTIGGVEQDFTYGELQHEMDMINHAYIDVMTKGDAKGRVFTFPIPTYNITKDFNWDSPLTDALFTMTAKMGTPYFQNFINSDMNPGDVRSMCPLVSSTPVVIRTHTGAIVQESIQQIIDHRPAGTYQVWTPSGWADAKPVVTGMTDVYHVSLSDNTFVRMGENHLQPTLNHGTLPARELQAGMTLPSWSHPQSPHRGKPQNTTITNITNLGRVPGENLYCFEVNNEDHVFMLGNGLITHNCRLQLDLRELLKRGNGLFGSGEQTGSVGVVTVNMARLGYLYAGDMETLVARLDTLLNLAKESLEKKRATVNHYMNEGLFPYTKRYLGHLNSHFSTIGVNGVNELIRNFTHDQHDITTPEGEQIAVTLLHHIRNRMVEFQEETGNLYNLEATPAEGTTYRFAKEDQARYPNIIQAGTPTEPYYTNSTQLPVNYTTDPFEALTKQDTLQTLYTGGTVLHLYMGERISTTLACKNLVKRALENHRLPYLTITPTFSVCPTHGYLNGEQTTCPECGTTTEVWTRVMGYFRPVASFNTGKQGEYNERTPFTENPTTP